LGDAQWLAIEGIERFVESTVRERTFSTFHSVHPTADPG